MEVLWLSKENRVVRVNSITELLQMGLPTGLQFSITAIGSMVMQSANNGLGGDYVSAFTAGAKLKQFTMCPFDAIATSVSVSAARTTEPEKLTESIRGCARALPWGVLAYGLLPA